MGGCAVLVTEYVDGFDLGKLLQRTGPLPVAEACEIVRQVAVALEYTHSQGFVHRDIKPSNVMLSRSGSIKLLDLGLARLQLDEGAAEMTATGQSLGTADYMAPEQVSDARSVDIRADIYSLGCTLMKLLTGRAPFAEQPTSFAKMTAHVSGQPPRLNSLRADIPQQLSDLVAQMLAKRPQDRPQSPADIRQALTAFCAGSDLGQLVKRAEASAPLSEVPRLDASPVEASPVEETESNALPWEPYNAQALTQYRAAGRPVLLFFRAKWALNADLLRRESIERPKIIELLEKGKFVPMLADWTSENTELSNKLKELLSVAPISIPLLAIYPAGADTEPIVLRDNFNEARLQQAIQQAMVTSTPKPVQSDSVIPAPVNIESARRTITDALQVGFPDATPEVIQSLVETFFDPKHIESSTLRPDGV